LARHGTHHSAAAANKTAVLKLIRCPRFDSCAPAHIDLSVCPSMSLAPTRLHSRSYPRCFTFYVADPISSIETRSLAALTRSYPRHFTFYVAHPIRSIHYFEQIKNFAHLLALWQSFSKPHLCATVGKADWSEERRGVETHSFLGGARRLPAAAGELRGAIR
jgi:hypothetical protein